MTRMRWISDLLRKLFWVVARPYLSAWLSNWPHPGRRSDPLSHSGELAVENLCRPPVEGSRHQHRLAVDDPVLSHLIGKNPRRNPTAGSRPIRRPRRDRHTAAAPGSGEAAHPEVLIG